MVTEMITLKLEDQFLRDIDRIVKEEGYKNRTEFLRRAIREKVEESRFKEAELQIYKILGNSKKKITKAEYEKIREEGFKKSARRLGLE